MTSVTMSNGTGGIFRKSCLFCIAILRPTGDIRTNSKSVFHWKLCPRGDKPLFKNIPCPQVFSSWRWGLLFLKVHFRRNIYASAQRSFPFSSSWIKYTCGYYLIIQLSLWTGTSWPALLSILEGTDQGNKMQKGGIIHPISQHLINSFGRDSCWKVLKIRHFCNSLCVNAGYLHG